MDSWSRNDCGVAARCWLRLLLVLVLIGFSGSFISCLYSILESADTGAAKRRPTWDPTTDVMTMSPKKETAKPTRIIRGVVVENKESAKKAGDDPDVADACVMM